MEYNLITFGDEKTNQPWKTLIKDRLKSAKTFEIHCWNEETKQIETALRYGTLKETDWAYGTVICGAVTSEFAEMLLGLPKPSDTEIYNKMTPFFSIFLDNGFSSEHYGTEVYIC